MPKTAYDCIILDGSDLMYRSFFALPPLKSPEGQPTSAITGTLNIIDRIKTLFDGPIIVVFDPPTKNHRHAIFPGYKEQRKAMPDDLRSQWGIAITLLKSLGYCVISHDGYEADDIIATLAMHYVRQEKSSLIVSHDKDLMQCVGMYIHIYRPSESKMYDMDEVYAKWKVRHHQIRDYLILVGDASDGFSGVLGIGPKTAAKLLETYGDIENIWQNRHAITGKVGDNLRHSEDIIIRNKALATIVDNIELPENIWHTQADEDTSITLLQSLGMARRIKKVHTKPQYITHDLCTPLPTHGPRYWHLSSINHDGLYYLCFWHIEGVWCSYMNPEELLVFLKQHPWSDKDYWWETIHIYRLGMPLPLTVGDVSLMLYASDSGIIDKDIFTCVQRYDPTFPPYDTLSHVLSSKELHAYHAYCLSIIAAKNADISPHYTSIERPLVALLAAMEKTGITINTSLLIKTSQDISLTLQTYQKDLNDASGYSINILSPKQLRQWIYEELKAPTASKTGKGQWSTSEEALEALIADFPILQKVIDFRMLSKLRSTYCEGLLQLTDAAHRIHTHYDQRGTITGRLSSSEPNVQNIPIRSPIGRHIREAFIASEGKILVSADYSQIELRLMAHFSEDPTMLHAMQSGLDIHQSTAATLFNISQHDVTEEQRRYAKTINFGLLYGMSAYGLAKQLHITTHVAQSMIEKYFTLYPGVALFMKEQIKRTESQGSIQTFSGRTIGLSRNASIKGWMQRLALNAPMQGSAAEIIKKAMIHSGHHPFDDKCHLLLQVHDELVFEVHPSIMENFVPFIRHAMENAAQLKVPLVVNIKAGENWENMRPC